MSDSFLNKTGLGYLWGKIKALIPTKTSDLTNDGSGSGRFTTLTDIQDKVSKTGDTMTGALNISDNQIPLSTPSSDVYGQKGLQLLDSNGNRVTYLLGEFLANGYRGLNLGAVRNINGNDVYNSINLDIDGSGNPQVYVSDATAWRTALNSVSKAGDTVYGRYYIKDDDMPTTTAPSETHYSPTIQWNDADDVMSGAICTLFTDTDERGFQMVSCRKINGVKKYHTLQISVDGDGRAVVHANAAAWRKVLAINSVSLSGVPVTGYITNGQKRLILSVPYPFNSGTSMTINTLSMVLRHVGGSTYVYLRSGTDGATYTSLGSGQTSIIANGAATRTNEIASFSVALKANWGFVITINFNYAMCINSTGTVVANNSPVSADITLAGTIS